MRQFAGISPSDRSGAPDRGAILILTSLVMMLLLFIAAFATDLGAWYRQGQAQQQAADVSSLNGMQAYDRAASAYLENLGYAPPVERWTDSRLDQNLRDEGERRAMAEALNTIMGLLETSGYSFTQNTPQEIQLAPQPNNPGDETIYTIEADDGTIVTVVRAHFVNADGSVTSAMSVSLTDRGKQYFSGLLRDAPQIERGSTAVLSNCNADCSQEIWLEPPFQGFAAGGQGDGFRPLLSDDNTVWTVNHHNRSGQDAEVVCRDIETESSCTHAPELALGDLYTHNKADDVIDNDRHQIYFIAHNSSQNRVGIACVDTTDGSWCSGSRFTALPGHNVSYYNSNSGTYFPGNVTAQGVWRVGDYPNDRLFALGQDGRIHCIDPDALGTSSPSCASYPRYTPVAGNSWTPTLGSSSQRVRPIMAELVTDPSDGDQKILSFHQRRDAVRGVFSCWNVTDDVSCWSSVAAGSQNLDLYASRMNTPVKFVRYNAAGAPTGFCIAPRVEITGTATLPHECVSFSGSIMPDVPNLTLSFGSAGGQVYGEGFTWVSNNASLGLSPRMFFGGLYSDRLNCYDWATQASCGSVDAIDLYGLTQITNECIVGVGHTSQFYSFSPVSMDACTGSTVFQRVIPCECGDGLTYRYGALEMPESFADVLNSASARVWGNSQRSGTPLLTVADLLAGPVQLSHIDAATYPELWLEIDVDSKVRSDGTLEWDQPMSASLSLTVQPTLAG